MAAELWLGCSPITWRRAAPLEEILRTIKEVGYEGAPAGYGPDATPEATLATFGAAGLRPAPGYLGARYHDPGQTAEILDLARAHAAFARALGCAQLFVAESCFEARFAVAGHEIANRADQLPPEGYRTMAETLNRVGEICLEHGVQACFHNHAGSYVETQDEFDTLLALTDPSLLFVGLDTGHLRFGGGDVVAFCRAHAPRIKALHLKDIDEAVLEEGRRQRWHYRTMVERGIFAELGEGYIDFPAAFEQLGTAGYRGWAIAEVDQTMKPTPRESVEVSYRYLRRWQGSRA